jgi:type IV pilus assembly protein PilC
MATIIATTALPLPATRVRPTARRLTWVLGRPRLPRKQLAEFTRSLATLIDAGLPIVRALRTLERQARDPRAKLLLAQFAERIEGGASLSEAAGQFPTSFDRFFVNMLRAGEASGALDQVLNELANHLERADTLAAKVKAALTYPIVVLSVALLITAGLLIFIVPRFAAMFVDMLGNEPLPKLTLWVMATSQFMVRHSLLAVALLTAVVLGFRLLRRTVVGARLCSLLALRLPPFGDLVTKAGAARFCGTLSTLIGAGVPVLNALQITRDTTGNVVLASAVQTVHDAVKEGESMARPLGATQVFPPMVVSMIEVGEETGALPEMLRRIARTYEQRVDMAVNALTALIEPLMVVLLGLLVGTIVIAMFMPLIKLVSLFGNQGPGE